MTTSFAATVTPWFWSFEDHQVDEAGINGQKDRVVLVLKGPEPQVLRPRSELVQSRLLLLGKGCHGEGKT
jgi:hypothetical protein